MVVVAVYMMVIVMCGVDSNANDNRNGVRD